MPRLAIPSKELALKIVGPTDTFLASRIQRLSIDTDLPTTYIDELGNPLHAGVSQDIPNVSMTFSAMDTGIRIFATMTGNDKDAYPGAGVDIANLTAIDGIIYVRDPDAAVYAKTGHVRRMQVRDFTFNYSVDGESTEDYTVVGTEKRWFTQEVIVDKFTSGTDSFSLSETPTQLRNGNYALSVILDGTYLDEVTGSPATGEYNVSGTTLTTFDTRTSQLLAVYQADTAETWYDVSDGTMPAAIRGRDVDIVIQANEIPRVQSVTINGNMNVTGVREMGNRNIIGYQRQVPTVEGTLTVLDTDTELIEILTTGLTDSGYTEFILGIDNTTSGIPLEVQMVDPFDTSSPYTVLKTVYIPEITVIGDSYTSNVNNNAVQVFRWRSEDSQCVVYSGARV